ncbi:MAG: DUF6265 family protein [Steroidobacteraceae bacterium]
MRCLLKQVLAPVVLALATSQAGAARADCGSIEELAWLLGQWTADGAKSSFHESWSRAGPHTYEGAGVERARQDGTVRTVEDLRLVQMAGEVFYVSKVTHNPLPVAFKLTACSDGRFVFENAAHDFPRRIEYRRDADGRLKVGVSDGADKGFTLDFARAARPAEEGAAVLAAEDARFAAMIAADVEAMRRWLAADLSYTHSTGQVEDRGRLVESIASGRTRYLGIAPSERTVTLLGPDAAMVRGRAQVQAALAGARRDFQARYLAVYRLQDGEWKLQSWQSVKLP